MPNITQYIVRNISICNKTWHVLFKIKNNLMQYDIHYLQAEISPLQDILTSMTKLYETAEQQIGKHFLAKDGLVNLCKYNELRSCYIFLRGVRSLAMKLVKTIVTDVTELRLRFR